MADLEKMLQDASSEIQACNTQNELNEIMDTFVRRDIHRFGKTTKLVL